MCIVRAVGRDGANSTVDVKTVQIPGGLNGFADRLRQLERARFFLQA